MLEKIFGLTQRIFSTQIDLENGCKMSFQNRYCNHCGTKFKAISIYNKTCDLCKRTKV